MVVCPKCNKELPDESLFCNECGTKIETEGFCPFCKAQVRTDGEFCANCGKPLKKKKKPQKKIIKAVSLTMVFVVIIASAICAMSLFFGKEMKAETDFSFYIKDNEIFVTDMKTKDIHTQITSQLINTEIDKEYIADALVECASVSRLSNDETLFFFTDKLSDESNGYNLYYRDLKELEAPAVKIDASVVDYDISASANIVTYEKVLGEQTYSLYQFSLDTGEKVKICEDVDRYYVSADGNRIIYTDKNDNLYWKDAEKDREKLAGEISYVEKISDNFSVIYYIKDNALYKQIIGEDRVKIATDVYSVRKIFDSGEVYYTKEKEIELCLTDYIKDDLREADNKIVMPEEPAYPDFYSYNTWDEYNLAVIAYEEKYEQYEQAYHTYAQKLNRDYYRELLSEATMTYSRYSLYFYNGTEEIKICENMGTFTSSLISVAAYSIYAEPERNSIPFSSVISESTEDVCDIVREKLFDTVYSSDEVYLCIKDKSTLIDHKNTHSFAINDDGTIVYFVSDISEDTSCGDLYVINIIDGMPSTPELYDSDVYKYDLRFIGNDQFLYFKNLKENLGDMYINKEKIDFDTYVYQITYDETEKALYYYVDYDYLTDLGTLKKFVNGESVKIADDIIQYYIDKEGRVFYLCDYSTDYHYGELYEWNKDESVKIDSDVFMIIPKDEIKKR